VNKYPFMNFPLHINEDIILMKIEGNIWTLILLSCVIFK
jgi:hypothetical protein